MVFTVQRNMLGDTQKINPVSVQFSAFTVLVGVVIYPKTFRNYRDAGAGGARGSIAPPPLFSKLTWAFYGCVSVVTVAM